MIVIVSDFGTFLSKNSERMVVTNKNGGTRNEYPFLDLEGVLVLNRGICLTTDLIFECQSRMINMTFIDKKTDVHVSFDTENQIREPRLIKNQVIASFSENGSYLAKNFVSCKIKNQRALLKFFRHNCRSLQSFVIETMDNVLEKLESYIGAVERLQSEDCEQLRKDLFIVEAHAAKRYFKAISGLVPAEIGFAGRVQRQPYDQFNIGLNYCYGILRGVVSNYINKYGLSKYIAFMHSDEKGKTSLTFDIMDEFRQITCDLPLISFFRGGGRIELDENKKITLGSRRELAALFFAKLNNAFKYGDSETSVAEIIDGKIGEIREFLLSGKPHKPFVLKW